MPLYEYECEACNNRFERIQKFSDPLVETCPKCGKGPVRKLISSSAIQFKGSGWYITDYAKKTSKESGSSKPSGSESSTETKTETKTSESTVPASTSADKKS